VPELTKTHSFRMFFFGDFAHWVYTGKTIEVTYTFLEYIFE